MISSIERFLNVSRKRSSNPEIHESEKNLKLFEQFSMGLFNTEIVEIYSSNVFPETIKYKNGDKFLLWDSAFWNIFNNIIAMYFMAIDAEDENLCEWIKQRLEAEIYYFMALKTWDEIELSIEFARSYRELLHNEIQFQITIEQLEVYSKHINEVTFIAKVFCLFHELNHMDNLESSAEFSSKRDAIVELFEITDKLLKEDSDFLSQVRQHFSEENIYNALLQIKEHKNLELEIELTCDLAALNDTVDFFEKVWTDFTKEDIVSRVNEVVIVFNSVNFALTQTYRYWHYNYQYFLKHISLEKYYEKSEHANQEAVLRYVLSDVAKSIQIYSLYGEKIDKILNTDYYGIRFQAENAFIEEVAYIINSREHFGKMCININNYENVTEEKLESLRKILLNW